MPDTDDSAQIDPLDTAICALCGGPNQCAPAADPSATACWCDSREFPVELLERVPTDAIRRVCICQKCLEQVQETNKESTLT